ncbi:MAG: CheR family methyltransferase [Acidobacteriota bacterium]
MSDVAASDIGLLRRWLKRNLGLRAEDYRSEFLGRRLRPYLQVQGWPDAAACLSHLDTHPREREGFLRRFFVGTTECFRNGEVFESFQNHFSQRIARFRWNRPVILSAACATGEEALSLAVLLEEAGLPGLVLAADRYKPALAGLREGSVPAKALQRVDRADWKGYFKIAGSRAAPGPSVFSRVHPLCCDLGWGIPCKAVHSVFLRNVFVYLTEEAQERIIKTMSEILVVGGLLVLGRVERIRGSRPEWEVVDRDCRIYGKIGGR